MSEKTKFFELPENISEVVMTYVIDEEDTYHAGGELLLTTRVLNQKRGIYLDFDSCGKCSEKALSADDLRNLAEELFEIANLADELE